MGIDLTDPRFTCSDEAPQLSLPPEGTVADDGTCNRELLAESDTTAPADGAGDVRVTVHWLLVRVTTIVGMQLIEERVTAAEGCSVMVANFDTPL